MSNELESARRLLASEIADCREAIGIARDPQHASACVAIVRGQARHHSGPWQRPEPWVGPIGARLLFLSSNPSIAYNGLERPKSLRLTDVVPRSR